MITEGSGEEMESSAQRTGVVYAVFSYVIWGMLPAYWKLLNHVTPGEILANRVLWSFVFMFIVLVMTRKLGSFRNVLQEFNRNPKVFGALVIASIIVSFNWFIYIFAVNTDQVVQASLGYYMNPLVSVLLGVIVLKEKLSGAQLVSFLLAAIGVIILTVSYGEFPWIAVGLAISFSLYGLAKKLIPVESAIGLTLETMVIAPIALGYIAYLFLIGKNTFLSQSLATDSLLICAGVVTALPLLYFAKGAKKIPLSTLGFLQYISPTMMLFLGVFIYRETFSNTHFLAFAFIWGALILYYLSFTKFFTWKKKREDVETYY